MSIEPTVTPRQLEVIRFIQVFRNRHGFSPTMQEIGDQLRLTKVTVFEHIEALVAKGLLIRGPKHKARSLRPASDVQFPDERPTKMPLVGRVAAGMPIEAIENAETFDLEEMFDGPGETFVLQVNGESMIDEHIRDGDYVICRRGREPRNGDTVVALLDDGQATLKRYYREKGRIRLQPANPNFKPIFASRVDVQGIVVGVIRKV